MDIRSRRPLAVVTGGVSAMGRELARQCIAHGYDLVLIAGSEKVHEVARQLGADVAEVYSQEHDLSTWEGVEAAWREVEALGRPIDGLMVICDGGGAGDFTRATDLFDELSLIRLNCDALVHLAKRALPAMVRRGRGRLLITTTSGATAVHDATRGFALAFAGALRAQLPEAVTVTSVQPCDDDAARMARQAFRAMTRGKDNLYAGAWTRRLKRWLAQQLPPPARPQKALEPRSV